MTHPPLQLVILDVGYTLGTPNGATIAQKLAALSSLPETQARRLAKQHLHTASPTDTEAVGAVCRALGIDPTDFPTDHEGCALTLFDGARSVVARIARLVSVVTLSNVTWWDDRVGDIQTLLAPHSAGHYPSWRLGFAKPDPKAVRTVAAAHGAEADAVLMIGDSFECDVRGALAAGARAVWVNPGPRATDIDTLTHEQAGRLTVVPDLDTAAAFIENSLAGANFSRTGAP